MKALLLPALLLLGHVLPGQTVVAQGRDLAALWPTEAGVTVQFGRVLKDLTLRAGVVQALEVTTLPADTLLFDRQRELVRVSAAEVVFGTRVLPLTQSPCRFGVPEWPLRVALMHGPAVVVPDGEELLWVEGERVVRVAAGGVHEEHLGYGLADVLRCVRVVPQALRLSADALVSIAWPRLAVHKPESKTVALEIPLEGADHLAEFRWWLAPLGLEDGVLVGDASRGRLLHYKDPASSVRPDQVLLLDGGVLALKCAGAGALRKLLVLRTRHLGIVDQLDVLRTGRLAVEQLVYGFPVGGSIARSPAQRFRGSLAITVSLSNDRRDVRPRGAVLMDPDALVVVEPDGRVLRSGKERGPAMEVCQVPVGECTGSLDQVLLGGLHLVPWQRADGEWLVLSFDIPKL